VESTETDFVHPVFAGAAGFEVHRLAERTAQRMHHHEANKPSMSIDYLRVLKQCVVLISLPQYGRGSKNEVRRTRARGGTA